MRFLKVAALILAVVLVVIFGYFTMQLGAIDKSAAATREVIIKSGQSRSQIAEQLFNEGLIRDRFAFFVYLQLIKAKVLPGTYELSESLSASAIADLLAEGKFKTVRVTLLEGWRLTDIERYLVNERKLDQLTGFAEAAAEYEGYLFPDTYELKADATAEEVIKLLRDNFTKRTKDLNVTPDVVTLASIVEREAKSDTERADIAQVYLNRIKIGMRLEADATVQYAKGDWKAVSVSDYREVISPYNTYINDGLPPGPIASPGLASIKAVLEPSSHDYFYYFHAKGETIFSKTHDEHRAKVRQYF